LFYAWTTGTSKGSKNLFIFIAGLSL